jgi:hypothetical protein
MTPSEYRDLLAALDLSQAGAARLLGVDEGTARRWASSSKRGRHAPPPVERFLRFLLLARISPDEVINLLGDGMRR